MGVGENSRPISPGRAGVGERGGELARLTRNALP